MQIDDDEPEFDPDFEAPAFTPALTEEQIEQMKTTAADLIRIDSTNFEAELRRVSGSIQQLPLCSALSYKNREPHNNPIISPALRTTDKLAAAQDLLLLYNLRKLAQPGYQEGAIYRGTTKGELKTVVKSGDGFILDVMRDTDLGIILDGAACWLTKKGEHGQVPQAIRKQLTGHHLPYPTLKSLSAAPRWSRRANSSAALFDVATEIGYDHATSSFITKNFDVIRRPAPDAPTREEALAALGFVREMIAEFPFSDETSRTNAISLALTMAMRNTWTTAPGFIVTAHVPNSGKTLLVETLHGAVYGSLLEPATIASKEGEQERRNLTAMFRDIPGDVVWFDEPRASSTQSEFGSVTLNRVLTAAAGYFRDRPVYTRETLLLDVQKTVIISGNNLPLNVELARRVVVISMQKTGNETYSKTEEQVRALAISQQAQFHQALATMIDYWQSIGSPPSSVRFASFNSWMEVVGGILESLDVRDLRTNIDTFVSPYIYATADFLQWIIDNVRSVEETKNFKTIQYADMAEAIVNGWNFAALEPLIEALDHYGSESDRRIWNQVLAALDNPRAVQVPQLISRAFRRIMEFDSISHRNGHVIWMRRLENNPQGTARIRFSTSQSDLSVAGGKRKGAGRKPRKSNAPRITEHLNRPRASERSDPTE